MKKSILYPKEWLAIHPYTAVRPSDAYYVTLANELLAACTLTELPEPFRRKLCLYHEGTYCALREAASVPEGVGRLALR